MNNIRKYRGKLGISLESLGNELGITKGGMSYIETKPGKISEKNTAILCKKFNCSAIELYGNNNFVLQPKNDADRITLAKIALQGLENSELKANVLQILEG